MSQRTTNWCTDCHNGTLQPIGKKQPLVSECVNCGGCAAIPEGVAEDIKHETYHQYGEPFHRRLVDLQ